MVPGKLWKDCKSLHLTENKSIDDNMTDISYERTGTQHVPLVTTEISQLMDLVCIVCVKM